MLVRSRSNVIWHSVNEGSFVTNNARPVPDNYRFGESRRYYSALAPQNSFSLNPWFITGFV